MGIKAPFHINMYLVQIQGYDSHFEVTSKRKRNNYDVLTMKPPQGLLSLAIFLAVTACENHEFPRTVIMVRSQQQMPMWTFPNASRL